MTTLGAPELVAALEPVSSTLLGRARDEADRVLADADSRAAAVLSAAREKATAVLDQARAAGESDAEEALAIDRARARRQARAAVFKARQEAYERLRDQSRAAVTRLSESPSYEDMREVLAQAARRALCDTGGGVTAPEVTVPEVTVPGVTVAGGAVEIVEAEGGGVVARAGRRSVDLSLWRLADRAVEALANELDEP